MLKVVALVAIASLLVVGLLTVTKVLNVIEINETGDASGYHDISAVLYVVAGILLCLVAYWTCKLHFVAGIVPWGLGLTLLAYGLYICYVKFVVVI